MMQHKRRSARLLFAVLALVAWIQPSFAETKVSGFADAQIAWHKTNAANQGFVLNDGAVYFAHEMGAAKVFVDIPFMGNGTVASANFTIGATKAQAYIEYAYSNGLSWTLGQWDTIFGFELNDSKDTRFTRQGIAYNNALPVVHTGLLLGYDFGLVGLKAYIGAPHDQSVMLARLDNVQIGFALGVNHDLLRLNAGLATHQNTALNQRFLLVDVNAGVTFVNFSVDIYWDNTKHINAPLRGNAFGGQVAYSFTDTLDFGLRFEYLRKLLAGAVSAAGTPTSQIEFTVGPQYQMTKHLRTKFDYTWYRSKVVGVSTNTHAINLAAVYSFGG